MKQRLETVSAILVVLVIGLAWFNDREQPSDSAGLSVIEAAQPAAQPSAMAAEVRSPVQQQDVPCTKKRDTTPRRIKTTGGKIKEDFAEVYFAPGAYAQDTFVQIIPDATRHGITIEPAPTDTVLVLLRLDYCDTKETEAYWLHIPTGHLPAYILESGTILKKQWGIAEVPPEAWRPPDPSIRTGFVILSN